MSASRTLRQVAIVPVASLALVAALLSGSAAREASTAARAADHVSMDTHTLTPAELAFHDRMRKLGEDHITWTRLAIVTFADGSAGFPATAARLLRNQTAIGDAIKPFYGKAAGNRLGALLHDHITIAVAVLQAAKAGDTAAFKSATGKWYRNANAIADFLAKANPKFWPDVMMRADMKTHLDQTLAEAADELQGHYRASVRDYAAVHRHILAMADMLSNGIIRTFPGAFR
jgi:hypothetical protein